MQALYGLAPNPGSLGGITAGVYSNGLTTFNGHAQLSGNPNNPNSTGDILSNGDLTLKGGGDDYGSVGVQACADGTCAGRLTLQGGTIIHQTANSKDALSISNNSQIVGTARSSLAGITGGGSIGGTAYYCTGSAPGNAAATIHECNSTLPVVPNWSTVAFTFDASKWTPPSSTYAINTYSGSGSTPCDNAYTFLTSPTGWVLSPGDYVLRISSSCTLSIKTAVTMYGNLAIISDGSFSMNSQGAFNSASARTLFLMFNINTPPPCTSTTGISLNAQSTISNNVQEVFYTPCAISFGAGSGALNVNGQIFAGSVSFGGGANIIASAIGFPGQDGVGFGLKMTYRREIVGS
jgi:hypothetical protein